MSFRGILSLGLVAAGLAAARPAPAAVVYGLTNGGTTLVQFDTATPGTVVTVGALGTTLNGLDFRVANGVLYGFNAATGEIYTVDRTTGAATVFSTLAGPNLPDNVSTGIDFNPVPNALRVVNVNDENFRITGAGLTGVNVDGSLSYVAGDPNFGTDPLVNEAAYTNSILPSPRSAMTLGTTLYYLDYGTDSLVTTNLPNAGQLTTVGNLGVGDISDVTGFDILTTAPNVNTAYATLTVGGVTSLYTINLTTGAATLVGATTPGVFGIAVTPVSVPEPTGLALVGLGVAGAGLARRLRRQAA